MIIPSIDLMDGKAVQLIGGKEKVLEDSNVFSLMEKFGKFPETAVIDLDRALNNENNLNLIKKLCKLGSVRVGGGLRNLESITEVLDAGAKKIIISSVIFNEEGIDFEFLKKLTKSVKKEKIIIAADSFNGKIAVKGWKNVLDLNVIDVISKTKDYCSGFLVTCIEKEGKMKGFDRQLAENLKKLEIIDNIEITVAGGVKDIFEIEELTNMGFDIQLGMALYTGKVDLYEAFASSLNYQNLLIPVITKDRYNQTLMMAYANKESLIETFNSGYMTYFSRRRKKLWKKGETSGNFQKFLSLKTDCDRDTLLITVEQKGNACHLDKYSCFDFEKFSLFKLEEVIRKRMEEKTEGSYTASLTIDMIKDKLDEECLELINFTSRENLIWEAADVLYFLVVFLRKNNVSLGEVIKELERRRKN